MMFTVIIITTIMLIVIIIAFKGATRDFFYNLLTAPRSVSNTYAQVAREHLCSASGDCHVQHVMCHLVRRDSSAIKFDRVEIAFILPLSYWLNH